MAGWVIESRVGAGHEKVKQVIRKKYYDISNADTLRLPGRKIILAQKEFLKSKPAVYICPLRNDPFFVFFLVQLGKVFDRIEIYCIYCYNLVWYSFFGRASRKRIV